MPRQSFEPRPGHLAEPGEHLVRRHRSHRFDPLLVEDTDVVVDVRVRLTVDLDVRAGLAGEHRLGADDVRLLTLAGSGGIGKTRLALQAAGHLVEAFQDGLGPWLRPVWD